MQFSIHLDGGTDDLHGVRSKKVLHDSRGRILDQTAVIEELFDGTGGLICNHQPACIADVGKRMGTVRGANNESPAFNRKVSDPT